MTLQSSGAIKFSELQTEFGGSNPISLSEYYAGGANVPSSTSGVNGAVPTSGTISMSKFYGTSDVAFSPDGGTSAGSPVEVGGAGATSVSRTLSCTTSAVWTFTRDGDTSGTASISSGSSATSVTFSLSTSFSNKMTSWTVSATAGGITRYWTVTLTVGLE